MPPALSIIIPTFKRVDSLEKTLTLLREQTLDPIEIILVDQNPPGYLAQQLPSHMLSGVTHLQQEEPNPSGARNAGFARAHADHLLFMDDDLRPEPDFCARGLRRFETDARLGCLVPVVQSQGGTHQESLAGYGPLRLRVPSSDATLWPIHWTLSAAVYFSRDCFRRSGGFDPNLYRYAKAGEDHELFIRMHRRGLRAWLDTTLFVEHDEKVPGGAELRVISAEANRERCARAWSFKAWAHSGPRFLAPEQIAYLVRNSVLNRPVLTDGPRRVLKELTRLARCLRSSRLAFAPLADEYRALDQIDHLRRYPEAMR